LQTMRVSCVALVCALLINEACAAKKGDENAALAPKLKEWELMTLLGMKSSSADFQKGEVKCGVGACA
jgi:hypothetical protein